MFRQRGALAPSGRGKYCRVPGWVDGSSVLSMPLYGDETGVGGTPSKPAMRACTEKGSIANRALPFFFSLVLVLKLPQQGPREKHGQDEPHDNAKGDITHAHKRITKTPNNPTKRTTPPIIPATIATFLLSKSSAITTPTHSYSVSTSGTPPPDLSRFQHDNP